MRLTENISFGCLQRFLVLFKIMAALIIIFVFQLRGNEIIANDFGDKTIVIENLTEVQKAHALLNYVISEARFLHDLNELYTIDLPVGIAAGNNKESEKYAIIIESILLREGQTFLTAYMAFTIPGTTKKIAFKGEAIPFSFNGGIIGDATMRLVSDFKIPISNSFDLILREGNTSVTFDCFGYKEMSLAADIIFDSTLFVPENPDGTIKEGSLRSSFRTTIKDWNNLMIGISIDPFQIRNLTGLGFTITNAVLDMSDFHNPANLKMPSSHLTQFSIAGNENLWRGVYLENLEVRLPRHFQRKAANPSDTTNISNADRVIFNAQNILIDDLGFTGKLSATGLIPLHEGDMSGWGFSLDRIHIELEASRLVSGGFNGQIWVPQLSEGTVFNYEALIGLNNTYSFIVGITDSLDFSLWAAQLRIDPNSTLAIVIEKNKFVPTLKLNGTLHVNAPLKTGEDKSKGLSIAKIPFQGMRISPVAPYMSVDNISYGSEQNRFAGFPVSVYEIGVVTESNRIGLKIGLNINFVESSADGFGGKGLFTIWGKQESGNWSYDRLEVSRITVKIVKDPAYSFIGQVAFIRGDDVYGDGFKGLLDASFAGFKMSATALFGNKDGFRYWYADAMVTSKNGIPAGPVAIYGFGGGAFYRMKQAGVDANQKSEIGKSASGLYYVPDKGMGLGIIASVSVGLSKNPETFNADARFGISFTSSGGLNQIFFEGNGYFATGDFNISSSRIMEKAKYVIGEGTGGTNIPADDSKSQLHAKVFINYDHPNKTFHATFDIMVNVAGGLIRGIGSGNKAGYGVIHFSPDDWYIHLGTPQNPNGIRVAGLAQMTNYLMVGKSIPELPEPPSQVLNSLREGNKNYSQQFSPSSLGDGSGFAFGAAFSFNTGERRFLIFYGRLGCGVGFDILLKNYGPAAVCDGRTGSLGINGWYAQGQAYAWVHASLGIVVRLPFYSGKYSILDLEVAALLQAKAPNPFWMQGNVGGKYRILGGLIKGRCNFEFEIGSKCIVTGGAPFGGTEIIADMSPADAETGVDVFTTPRVLFNMPVDREIQFQDENKNTKIYRIRLTRFIVNAAGQPMQGTVTWNESNDVVAFNPLSVIPGETEIRMMAEVSFQEKKSGLWTDVRQDGKVVTETREITFRTGVEPDYIREENILYAYPGNKAFNFYPYQSTTQYIQLNQGQNLFNPGPDWIQKVRLVPVKGGNPLLFNYSYNVGERKILMNISEGLLNNTIYRLELVNLPVTEAQAVDVGVTEQTRQNVVEEEGYRTDLEITTRKAEQARKELQEKVIYSMVFRASSHNTLTEKLNNLSYSKAVSWELNPRVHSLTVNINGERFDSYEVMNLQAGTLINIVPLLGETTWYTTHLQPLFSLTGNDFSTLGVGAFNPSGLSTYFFQSSGTRILTEGEISTGNSSQTNVLSGIKYMVAREANDYLYLLKTRIANLWVNSGTSIMNSRFQQILGTNFIPVTYGNYPVMIYYTLPGQQKPLLEYKYVINF